MIVRYTNPSRIRDQLLHCLDVLGEEYNELDYVVDVYKNEDRLRKEMVECPDMSPEEYQQILHGATRPPAIAMMESRTIKIFYFNLSKEKHKQDLDLAFFLFHEMRHAWQNHHGLYLDEEGVANLDENMEEYKNSAAEKDANEFAMVTIMENKDKIRKIFKMPDFELNLKW
ncbi:hypothetical protein [Paenibacillus odorifer]|uniref:hypothetical protein n=1 Tax=Paenibacillus sp. FSL L8-0333 TaxID=2975331 RepID=UPI00096E64EA|nr:hypothetical protein BJP47_15345 [Paenibacillus odorifer]